MRRTTTTTPPLLCGIQIDPIFPEQRALSGSEYLLPDKGQIRVKSTGVGRIRPQGSGPSSVPHPGMPTRSGPRSSDTSRLSEPGGPSSETADGLRGPKEALICLPEVW